MTAPNKAVAPSPLNCPDRCAHEGIAGCLIYAQSEVERLTAQSTLPPDLLAIVRGLQAQVGELEFRIMDWNVVIEDLEKRAKAAEAELRALQDAVVNPSRRPDGL